MSKKRKEKKKLSHDLPRPCAAMTPPHSGSVRSVFDLLPWDCSACGGGQTKAPPPPLHSPIPLLIFIVFLALRCCGHKHHELGAPVRCDCPTSHPCRERSRSRARQAAISVMSSYCHAVAAPSVRVASGHRRQKTTTAPRRFRWSAACGISCHSLMMSPSLK